MYGKTTKKEEKKMKKRLNSIEVTCQKERKKYDFLIKNLFIIRTVKAIARGVFFLSNIDYNYKQLIVHLNHSNDMKIYVRLGKSKIYSAFTKKEEKEAADTRVF